MTRDSSARGGRGFPRDVRVRRAREYRAVFRGGVRSRTKLFEACHAANSQATARLGIVVPKRQVPKACRRNRLKRIIRESFRQARLMMPPRDIVVRVMTPMDRVEPEAIRAALTRLWREVARFERT